MTEIVKEQVSLSQFDFGVNAQRRYKSHELYDGICSVRNSGRTRKTASHDINLSNFMKRNAKTHKSLAIGANRFKKGGKALIVFDNNQFADFSAAVHVSAKNETMMVHSKAHVKKLLELFDLEIPTKDDTQISFYFKLIPIEGQPNVYIVSPVQVTTYDAQRTPFTKSLK